MDEEPNYFNKFLFLVDKNLRGVQYGVYSVAFVGITLAVRSVRPFARFKRPSDVPNRFINTKTILKGTVDRIEPNGALLMVQHRPLIRLSRSKTESLPVKVAGVNISGHGISWLQSIVAGNEIKFVPILKHNDYLQCVVTLPQAIKDKKIRNVNLGPTLISIGFGTIAPIEKSLLSDADHLKYYRQLMAAEQAALRKKMGVWYYAEPTKEMSLKLVRKILSLFREKPKSLKITT